MEDFSTAPLHGVNVRDAGARGDGDADDAPAIQRVLDRGPESVAIPAGIYKLGAGLRLPSGCRLRVHPQARLFLADGAGTGPDVFLLTNSGDRDIRVDGGIWDGNSAANPRGLDRPGSYTGVLVNFAGVDGLTLRGLTVSNPESYYIRLAHHVRNFRIEDITFATQRLRPNQDGVHLGGFCEDGLVRRLRGLGRGTPNDDVVAVNADDMNHRAQNLGKLCGPIRRLRVEDVAADDCHTFVRLLSVWSPIEDVEIDGIRGGCEQAVLNLDAGRYCMVPLFNRDDPAYAPGVGVLRRIVVRHVRAHKSCGGSLKPLVHVETTPDDFRIEDFVREESLDARLEAPTLVAANLPPATHDLRGLAAARAAACVADSSDCTVTPGRDALPDAAPDVRLTIATVPTSRLVLAAGGFAGYHAAAAAVPPLPPKPAACV